MDWNPLHTYLHPEELAYDGSQIEGHWAFRTWGLQGDSAVAFAGPCRVETAAMVDLADVREQASIAAASMLHFIVEHFDGDLERGVLRQRLLVALAQERINALRPGTVTRRGDDLYTEDMRKVSVSIAAPTTVSVKIHLGLNIDPTGAPVRAAGLSDFEIEPADFARSLLHDYREEIAGVYLARCKVRLP